MISIIAVPGLPEIVRGDDLGGLIAGAIDLEPGDVVIVSQKVVSKAEGAVVDQPAGLDPAEGRRAVARHEAVRIVADTPSVLIVETSHGFVCANAGVDASNAGGSLTLLPADPDRSARAIRASIQSRAGVEVAVVIADTFGRAWRVGQTDVAIGVAGLDPLRDERGHADRDGRVLDVTQVALADELAAAADLVRDKASGVPAVVVRGASYRHADAATARDLVRAAEQDLFRRGKGMLARELAGIRHAAPPPAGGAPLRAEDLEAAGTIAPGLEIVAAGPPTRLRVPDEFAAGLVAAALTDLGYEVRRDPYDGLVLAVSGTGERR